MSEEVESNDENRTYNNSDQYFTHSVSLLSILEAWEEEEELSFNYRSGNFPSLSCSSQSLSTAMSTTREDQEMPPPSRIPASAKGKGKASNQDDGSDPLGNKRKRLACEVRSISASFRDDP